MLIRFSLMAQKIRKIQIGNTTIEQIIEVPDADPICELKPEPKRRGRKSRATDDYQSPEAVASIN